MATATAGVVRRPTERAARLRQLQPKDEDWKDELLPHLEHYELDDLLEVWDDRRIEPGGEWYAEHQATLDAFGPRARLPDFRRIFSPLAFCQFEEIPLPPRSSGRKRNLEIVPVLLRALPLVGASLAEAAPDAAAQR